MVESLQALLREIIDYAGLFPPAKLSMDSAVRNYLRYNNGREDWLVGRFVCPATRLRELESHLERAEITDEMRLCVTGRGGEDSPSFLRNTLGDLVEIRDRCKRTTPEFFEVRIPAGTLVVNGFGHLLTELKRRSEGLEVVLELPFTENWEKDIPSAIKRIALSNGFKVKIRTGGIEPSAFPSPQQVALFISACATNDVPFKATAGLHHPVRAFDKSVNCEMFGFFNVFFAALVAKFFRPEVGALEEILVEKDPRVFHFEPFAMSYKSYRLTNDQVREARQWALSFGSCSVEEPLEDLRTLGYLSAVAI